MPSDKDRVYIGLYARDVPNTYHRACLKTPKEVTGAPKEKFRCYGANGTTKREGMTKYAWSAETGHDFSHEDLEAFSTCTPLVSARRGNGHVPGVAASLYDRISPITCPGREASVHVRPISKRDRDAIRIRGVISSTGVLVCLYATTASISVNMIPNLIG